ncbi:carbohydrate kinase family protein [Nocardioides abyssi]|uniref:Carbohydrate kinase n=1 Tax=Nocardioides abyssi TaxID=3058370 RepID=A0ABT8EWW9_9ACTN|nr:carbohydrate kinase [Nocardioides abyssi]MDN4162675.1 carbohydrate kinase [Nocardioides abyssi]
MEPDPTQEQQDGRDVLVVGESLVDVVHAADGTTREHPGGSAANVAVALARLGRPVRFATAYAADDRGRTVADHLATAGVALATDPATVARTSTARATIGADGAATYDFDLAWELGPVPDEPAPLVVHTCSLGAVLPPGADDVVALLERLRGRATVTYDVNARPAVTGTGAEVVARVERVVALADLVKASDEDLAALWPDLDEPAAVARLLALGPAAVVVTRGGEGASWTSRRCVVEVASLPVEVADTIGAGDTFGAALVDGLWERGRLGAEHRDELAGLAEHEVAELLEHAARAAAVTVSRPGADPPYRSELQG